MKRRIFKSSVICFLIMCMLLSSMPFSAFAETNKEKDDLLEALKAGAVSIEEVYGKLDEETVPEIVGYENAVENTHVQRLYEDEGEELNKVVFLNADGSKTMYLYDYPVKYVDDTGSIKDITLDIAPDKTSGEFKTVAGSSETTFSRNAHDGIELKGNGETISLTPHIPSSISSSSISEKVSNISDSVIAKRIDDKTISYKYDDRTSIEYSLTYTGFKEDIVVDEYTGQTEYEFTLQTNGLKLIEIDNSFYLVDHNNTVKATLGDIIIFTADEKNNTMGDMISETVEENQEYLLTIIIDPEFLSDEKTAYPIRIDPTVEICYDSNGSGAIEDVTINSADTSTGSSGALYIGKRTPYGISRVLMRFPGLNISSFGSNITITNAKVEIRDIMCESEAMDIYCYVFTGNTWNESTVGWSAVSPNSYSTQLSSKTVSYSIGTQNAVAHRYSFDITEAVEGWRTGNYNQSKGIIFKASSSVENGSTYIHKTFASYNRSSNKPSLSVSYATEDNYISNGTYYLNNTSTGKYLTYGSSSVSAASGLISNLGNSIRWEIVGVDGGCVIRSKSDTTKYLGVSETSTSPSVVTVSGSSIPSRCIWIISGSSIGGCLVKNKYNSRYLYSAGTSLHTLPSPGTSTSSYYANCAWRIASTSYYGNTSSNEKRELSSGFSVSSLVVNIGSAKSPSINKYPSNSLWSSDSDFNYSYSSGSNNSVTFDYSTGKATGNAIGISNFVATHKVTNRAYTFNVYVDQYTYELVSFFGFDSDAALLIRDLYNCIDNNEAYASKSEKYKAWVSSRVLSEFSYDSTTNYFDIVSINRWDDVAGSVTSIEDRQNYFVNTLGYSEAEYNTINSALTSQHSDTDTSDFTHMQYSLSARLAKELYLDGHWCNVYTLEGNENVSYLAGWYGDATLISSGTTHLGKDDYMADLDAENLFRLINSGSDSVEAFNNYYNSISNGSNNRAAIFKSYLSYSTVESMVLSELNKTLDQVRTSYPDTYDFLMSLKNNLAEMEHY